MNNNKRYFYASVWSKYLPIIRILMKRAAVAEQTLIMNRIDFEKAGGTRKAGYKFTISFIKAKPDIILAANEMIQSFITAILEDEMIKQQMLKSDYTFSFSGKFELQIRHDGWREDAAMLPEMTEEKILT